MLEEIAVIDNFCPMYQELLKTSKKTTYQDVDYGNGAIFPKIGVSQSPWAYSIFQEIFHKEITPVVEFFRIYKKHDPQPTFIHSDEEISTFSAVLCLGEDLNKDYGGLAFWERYRFEWHLKEVIPLIPNRCIIFPSALPHSRWPEEWDKAYNRKIQVFFFNPKEES